MNPMTHCRPTPIARSDNPQHDARNLARWLVSLGNRCAVLNDPFTATVYDRNGWPVMVFRAAK